MVPNPEDVFDFSRVPDVALLDLCSIADKKARETQKGEKPK